MYSPRTCNHGDLERLRLHRTPCLHFLDAGAMLNGGEKRLSARTERLDNVTTIASIASSSTCAHHLQRHAYSFLST